MLGGCHYQLVFHTVTICDSSTLSPFQRHVRVVYTQSSGCVASIHGALVAVVALRVALAAALGRVATVCAKARAVQRALVIGRAWIARMKNERRHRINSAHPSSHVDPTARRSRDGQ